MVKEIASLLDKCCSANGIVRNTDYVLVPAEKAREAVVALEADGWMFTSKAGL